MNEDNLNALENFYHRKIYDLYNNILQNPFQDINMYDSRGHLNP